MNEHKAVPNIRFKGFEDEWSEKKLDNVVAVIMGQSPSSSNYHDHQVNHSMILIQGNADIENNKIKPRLWTTQITKETIPNDIILTVRAPVGEVAKNDFDAVIGRGVAALRGNRFLYYYLENINQIGYWNRISTGSTFMSISSDDIKEVKISLPRCKEQKYIYTFFTKLDKLLDLQQQKIDKLELLKKALLQKLFPKHDAKVPELRFKDYDQEWEEKKFSSLYKKCNEKNNLSFGSNKIISVANMYYKKDNVKSDDNYMRTYNIFRLGDIAFEGHKSKKFTFGRFVENTIGDGIVSHVFEVFRPISNGDITYWKYAIHNEDFIARILMKSTVKATMMNNLIAKDFLKQRVPVPQLSEQQKIGNLLSKIDQLIELENKKLQNFQQVKKCLLQNMFVD
ncbi:restriction endonuclease subunit S [Lactobacillus melliventris]|uniref:Restriction endonuclease subunit S n=1 Tax=Lactobacillus melliventris TaxID=1218507 RepID=A0ABX5N274_9LACO|nr:restriction endonuclease subunit S [Lactobacillus melliventris]PXY84199.1 restriction endonuclease subunit S [Lactobacillus melliventris]